MSRAFNIRLLAGALFCTATASGFAESTGTAQAIPDSSLTVSIFRMIGALAMVLAVFAAGVWLFKNWQRLTARGQRSPRLQVLEVKPLGARHALYVVGYEHQRLLLASSPAGVTMLTNLPGADETPNTVEQPSSDFAGALRTALGARP